HAKRALNSRQFLVRRMLDIETAAPYSIGLCGQRRDQCGKELIAYRNPFRAGDIFLVKRSRRALSQPEKSAASTKPADINSFCSPIDAPDQPRVIRVISRMNWRSRAERDKITWILEGL